MSEVSGGRTVAEWEASGETVVFVLCAMRHVVAGFRRTPHPMHPVGVWSPLVGAVEPEASPDFKRGPDAEDVMAYLEGNTPRSDDMASMLSLYARNGYAADVPSASRVSAHVDLRCARCGHARGPRWGEELWAIFDRLAEVECTRISVRDLADREGLARRLGVSLPGLPSRTV